MTIFLLHKEPTLSQQLIFLRHSKTDNPPTDAQRRLTGDGKLIAVRRRIALENPRFSRILISPFLRTKETGLIVGGDPLQRIETIPELLPQSGSETAITESAVARLGNVPTSEYLRRCTGAEILAFMDYSKRAWEAIFQEIYDTPDRSLNLVVGNAILIGFIGMYATPEPVTSLVRIGDFAFDECEGFSFMMDDRGQICGATIIKG